MMNSINRDSLFQKFKQLIANDYHPLANKFTEKTPIVQGWNSYANIYPSDKELIEWCSKLCGISLICGDISRLIVIDIDSDDQFMMSRLPDSDIKRVGIKGEARFFKGEYQHDFTNLKIDNRYFNFELKAENGLITIPPSVHPETMEEYKWITEKTLYNTSLEDLPEFTEEHFSKVKELYDEIHSIPQNTEKIAGVKVTGRNNTLVRVATAMIVEGQNDELIISKLIKYDETNHPANPLFSDQREMRGSVKENATRFTQNVKKTITRNNIPIEKPMRIEIKESSPVESAKKKLVLPEPRGFLRKPYDLINRNTFINDQALAWPGALSILAPHIALRYKFRDTHPNIYMLCVADSGFGKSSPKKLNNLIYMNLEAKEKFENFNGYTGEKAFLHGLDVRPWRMDNIDEIHKILKLIKYGYDNGLSQAMVSAWSDTDTLIKRKQMSQDSKAPIENNIVMNPCVTILGYIQPDELLNSLNKIMITNGLVNRFLVFQANTDIEESDIKKTIKSYTELDIHDLISSLKPLFKKERVKARPNEINSPYIVTEIGTKESIKLSEEFSRIHLVQSTIKHKDNIILKNLITRHAENANKLALYLAVSDNLENPVVLPKHVIEANEMVGILIQQEYDTYTQILGSTEKTQEYSGIKERIIHKIKKCANEKGLAPARIVYRDLNIKKQDFENFIKDLEFSSEIGFDATYKNSSGQTSPVVWLKTQKSS